MFHKKIEQDVPSVYEFPGGFIEVETTTYGLLAATERALSLKNHWLIDMETNTFDSF